MGQRATVIIAATFAVLATAPRAGAQPRSAGDSLVRHLVSPVCADSSIRRFTDPNYIVFEAAVPSSAPLLLFLPGTGGRPERTSDFADVAAAQGYRVIGLEYTDVPAVAQLCPRDPDPRCSERVRTKRIYGDDVTRLIDDRAEESIVHRLVAVLRFLHREHPSEGWGEYLDGDRPKWERIAVSGLSQGAGMAAFIAQRSLVARVILFSSPWDSYGPRRMLAPWVTLGPGATPPDRWYGAYHEREPTAETIRRAYAALGVPREHTLVFTLEPAVAGAPPAYHPSVVGNGATPRLPDGTPAYLEQWRFMLGTPAP